MFFASYVCSVIVGASYVFYVILVISIEWFSLKANVKGILLAFLQGK
jgi:hypothetical protein